MTNYDDTYDVWADLPQCRIRIPGERIWGRVISVAEGIYGIDNFPLALGYRYQDIVKIEQKDETGTLLLRHEDAEHAILHRRWAHILAFRWDEPLDKTASATARQEMADTLRPLGFVSFWDTGVMHMLIADGTEEEAVKRITLALAAIQVEPEFLP